MPPRPRRPAQPLAGAQRLAVEHPGAALAFEGDALRRRRDVGIDREDAAVARAGDAVALAPRDLAGGALQRPLAAGEEDLVARRLAARVERHPRPTTPAGARRRLRRRAGVQ